MSSYFTTRRVVNIGAATLTGTTAVAFSAGIPIDVQNFTFVASTAVSVASTVTVAVRNVDDSSSVTIGTITIPILALNEVARVGIVQPKETVTVGVDGSKIYKGYNPGGPLQVNPGQELVLTPVANGGTGVVVAYADFYEQGFSGSRVEDAKVATFVAA